MIPGEATVVSALTQSQSSLRKVSSAYCSETVEAGWVEDSGGLAGFASMLLNGRSENEPETYAGRIGAETDAPALVIARIVNDTQAARDGLANVSREAKAVLDSEAVEAASRSDVMSYERALVRAQMAYRSFHTALGDVAARPDMDMDTSRADAELKSFADTIDDARETADSLADKYAALQSSTS